MFGEGNSGGMQGAQATRGLKRRRGYRSARVRVEHIAGRSDKQTFLGEVECGSAGQRAKDFRRRCSAGSDEREFIVAVRVFRRVQIDAQRLGRARERPSVGGHDAVWRERHAQQAVQCLERGSVRVAEQPPVVVRPGSASLAPKREGIGLHGHGTFVI